MENQEVARMLESQQEILESIKKILTNFKKDGPERKTPVNIKRRLDTLDMYWSEFKSNHTRLLEYGNKSHPYFSENTFQQTLETYESTKTFILSYKTDSTEPRTPILKAPTLSFEGTGGGSSGSSKNIAEIGTSNKLEEMLRKQKSNFKAFTRATNIIKVEEIEAKWEFEDALKTLERCWETIHKLHWEIDAEQLTSNEEYERAFSYYEDKYITCKKSINTKMWATSHREKSTPKIDIPTFNGSYHQWVSFNDLFSEGIHNNSTMSDAQKMQFLKSKLKGEAERLIQHLKISSENYKTCWEILNHRYNNKYLIFNSQMNILFSIPNIPNQAASHIKRIHDTALECLNAVKNIGADISNWDPLVIYILSQKLDPDTHQDYVESLKNPRELPKISDFLTFLESKFTSLESARPKRKTVFEEPQKHHHQAVKFNGKFHNKYINFSSKEQNSKATMKRQCPLCKNEHGLYHCETFVDMTPFQRRNTVAKLKICENCLFDHYGKKCISEKTCTRCNEKHNTFLHEAFATNNRKNETPKPSEQRNTVSSISQKTQGEVLLATAEVNVETFDGSQIKLRALIDQGSQISLITEHAAQRLGLPRQHCQGTVFGVGAKEQGCKGAMNIQISSRHEDYSINSDVLIMKQLINNLPNKGFKKPEWFYLNKIQLADPQFYVSRPIDLLLGADIYSSIIQGGIIKEDDSKPIAQQTRFGWILCGKTKSQSYNCNIILNNIGELQRFWEIEDVSEGSSVLSKEDQLCIEHYNCNTYRRGDGMYVVRLPMKPETDQHLGESKSKATAQFKQIERKLLKKKNLENQYKIFMKEYNDLGHMTECVDQNMCNQLAVYLPHHCVQRAESTTTKCRVVFNASSKTSSGQSLNDLMFRGPNLQQNLFSLILRWRQYEYAFTADIEKMFRFINLHENDQHYQRIVWRENPSDILREYQLTTVTYGTKAAPFLAMMTLRKLAQDEKHKYQTKYQNLDNQSQRPPDKVIEEDFYMDDLLSGSYSLSMAQQLKDDLIEILSSGGFNLRKWSSNKIQLSENIKTENNVYDFIHPESMKTLGLRWQPTDDTFIFQLKLDTFENKIETKRTLLSEISKLFDPLGWLSPVTTKLKLLFQKLWSINLKWDDPLPNDIQLEWQKIKQDLIHLNKIQLPRWLQTQQNEHIELHGFCDASIKAYCAVIYCKVNRIHDSSNDRKITLVTAKTRLVPSKKSISLPRLELCAAHLLSNLMRNTINDLSSHNINIFGWSDSTAVLGWLRGDPNRWKTFVANRVQQITEVMPSECWRYVNTAENPADAGSRGISASQLIQSSLWWNGPTWLPVYRPENEQESPLFIIDEEIKLSNTHTNVTTKQCDDVIDDVINKQSSFMRAVRIIAWVLRFKSKCKKLPFLSTTEIRNAKKLIIMHTQQKEFANDIKNISTNTKLESKSKLLSLTPFLDADGVLRIGGRIRNANINTNMKHPVIIPHKSRLTDLLIDQAHKLTLHGGPTLTQACLRQNYWIIGGNRAVKKQLRNCVTCKRQDPVKPYQIMGDLPAARVNTSKPFYHTGVDFTGYVEVKANKGRGIKTTKGYIALFICMATKAVHLELVSDLTTSSFLAALRRMVARRGVVGHMYSDNGTNFVGASRILKEEFKDLQWKTDPNLFSVISDMDIEWHRNAPLWSSAGGIWERGIRSMRHHLKRVIGEQKLTYEEYSTLLSQIEACLNSRPLCPLTEDANNLDFLTPAHFLSGGPTLTIVETEKDERTRWQLTQKIFQDIWKRWKSEYLTQLSEKTKWKQAQQNLQINDIVIIHDQNLPPGKWAMGRIVETHPGKDGYVRVVTVKTKNGLIKRPVIKLSPLPVYPESPISSQPKKVTAACTSSIKFKRSFKPKNILFTILFILLSSVMSASALNKHAYYNITQLTNNQSLYFDKIMNMQALTDEWNIITYYDLNPYWKGMTSLKNFIGQLQETCDQFKELTHCNMMLLQMRHGYSELQYYNNILQSQQQSTSKLRQRRGLINGVGTIARSLFGVLDEQFAEKYEQDIALINQNQAHLGRLWKNQTSILEAENNLLKRSENTLNKQQKIINQRFIAIENVSSLLKSKIEQENKINDFTIVALTLSNMLQYLTTLQRSLIDTVTDVYHGTFNVHILSTKQLSDELALIAGRLSNELALPIRDVTSELHDLYSLLKVKARVTDNFILFEIKVPLISRDQYEIFQIFSIPQKRQNKILTVQPTSEYIAVDLKRDLYSNMNQLEIQNCIHYKDKSICELQHPIYQSNNDRNMCIKEQDSQNCAVTSQSCKEIWNQLKRPNSHLYFCCSTCTIKIVCPSYITSERLTGSGVISVSKYCVIKTNQMTIYPKTQQTSILRTEADFDCPNIAPINYILNVSIAQQQILDNSSDAEQTQGMLNAIQQQINEMKKEEPLSSSISYHDVHHYTAIYVMMGLAGCAAAGYVWRKLQKRRQRPVAESPARAGAPHAGVSTVSSDGDSACVNKSEQQCVNADKCVLTNFTIGFKDLMEKQDS